MEASAAASVVIVKKKKGPRTFSQKLGGGCKGSIQGSGVIYAIVMKEQNIWLTGLLCLTAASHIFHAVKAAAISAKTENSIVRFYV